MGFPINSPMETATGLLATSMVRRAERQLDQAVDVVGAPLGAVARRAAAKGGPMFIVSGYAGSTIGLGPIVRSATRDGITTHPYAIPNGGLGSIAQAVEGLDQLITTSAPTGPIHLAGHSKGGPVVLEWWRQATPRQRAQVQSVTLLSSTPTGQQVPALMRPMQELAQTFGGPFSTIMYEASATSPTMRAIAKLDVPAHARARSVLSVNDEMIKPAEAHWPGAPPTVLIAGADAPKHIATLGDARAYEALRANVLG